jgi:hypothetical protein
MIAMARRAAMAAASVILAAQMAQPQPPDDGVDAGGSAVPYLKVAIQTLDPSGPGGLQGQMGWDLRRDEVTESILGAGSAEYADLCNISSGAQFQPGTRVAWRVEGRLISRDATGARVWVRWTRTVVDPTVFDGGNLVREYETHLVEGVTSVLDLVRPLSGRNPSCDGVVVKMWMEFEDAPALANQVLDYDIWFVHTEADGRQVVDRTAGRALQGKDVDYLFKRLRYDATGVPDPDGAVDVEVRGSVKGRVRPDGRIDLSVGAFRTVWQAGLGNGENGNKQATIGDGDTLELEMPPTRQPGPGFAAQRTSIRVTVRRLS